MLDRGGDLERRIYTVAERQIQRYARGILAVDVLVERMSREWETICRDAEEPSQGLLTRIAQRICSRELYAACCSPHIERRNCAFDNLKRYLDYSLRQTGYAQFLAQHAHAVEDVVHQVLQDLHAAFSTNPPAGPDDPAAFLKWAQTILLRHAYAFVQKAQREAAVSLDAQSEAFLEQFVEKDDPQERVLQGELQQALENAILSLKNPRYRQVLLCTYLAGMEEKEIADHLGVQVQEVYLWRHRALKALRSNPEVMQALRPWLR